MAKAGIVYVGTDTGLVTYSDPGETGNWRRVGQSLDGMPVRAIDAVDAINIVVALENNPPQRSTDGGITWNNAQQAESEHLLAPRDHNAPPAVATAQGLAKWAAARHPAPTATALALLSGRQETLLASGLAAGAVACSEDGGATWEAATMPTELQGNVQVIQPSAYHMDVAWSGTDAGELLCSTDRGRTWHIIAREQHPICCLAVLRIN